MSSKATLHSRLRVLVAKTFRAEQLYASMRQGPRVEPECLTEEANNTRASVWQRSHRDLREALNEALSLPTISAVASRVQTLRIHFEKQYERSLHSLNAKAEQLSACVERQEFATSLKLSAELIELKAHVQANQIIAEELAETLALSGRSSSQADQNTTGQLEGLEAAEGHNQHDVREPALPSNVIPLRKRFSG